MQLESAQRSVGFGDDGGDHVDGAVSVADIEGRIMELEEKKRRHLDRAGAGYAWKTAVRGLSKEICIAEHKSPTLPYNCGMASKGLAFDVRGDQILQLNHDAVMPTRSWGAEGWWCEDSYKVDTREGTIELVEMDKGHSITTPQAPSK